MRIVAWAALAAAIVTTPAAARCFEVAGRVLVERTVSDGQGQSHTVLAPTTTASPGDRLVFQIDYKNVRPYTANNMVVTNPVPAQLVYAGSDTPGATVSVDGGQTYGTLAELSVTDADGIVHAATAADVTHVRWVVTREMPSGTGGQLSFRAAMRDVNVLPSRNMQMAMR